MAKKKTMKRNMKKGTRKCRSGGTKTPRVRTPTTKGKAYKASIDTKGVTKIQNQALKAEVDDLTEAFGNAMKLSSPK